MVTANGAVYTNHKVNLIAIIVKEYIVLQWGFSENAMVMLCIYQLWCNGKMLLLLKVVCVVLYKRKNQPCEVVMPCEEGYRGITLMAL